MARRLNLAIVLATALSLPALARADDTPGIFATYVSIIIDDLGNNRIAGNHVARLPGPVACAILPHTPYAKLIGREAHSRGKEILLHLPMEAVSGAEPGPGALDTAMSHTLLLLTMASDFASVPYVTGVNNHMGSLLSSRARPMRWVMQEIHQHGKLFFVDSRTSSQSVAASTASAYGVPNLARNVFLDDVPNIAAVEQQFALLLRVARTRGYAIAIGHPYPATVAVLQQQLPMLAFYRIHLVSLSRLLDLKEREKPNWPVGILPALFDSRRNDVSLSMALAQQTVPSLH